MLHGAMTRSLWSTIGYVALTCVHLSTVRAVYLLLQWKRQTHPTVAGIYQAHRTTSHAGRKAEAFRRGRRGEGIPSGTDYRVWRVDAPWRRVRRLIQWPNSVNQSVLHG